jgi:hypoxanthine phosphoribosyltransferase
MASLFIVSNIMEMTKQPLKIELVSNARVSHLSRKLAHQVQDSGFCPEIVICIARGGYVPARLICDVMNIFNLASIRIKHYTGSDKSETAELLEPLSIDIEGMNVLLVDDIDDTGDTLQLALNYLKRMQPKDIKVAVLHHKVISSLVPDYYAQKIVRWRWITYPWAIVEDVLGFVRKLQPPPSSIDEAIERIAEDYRIKISKQVMEDVFRLL